MSQKLMMDLLDASPPQSVSRAYSCGTTKSVSHPPGPLFLWPPIIQKPSLDFPTEWQLGSMREEEKAASPFKACASTSIKMSLPAQSVGENMSQGLPRSRGGETGSFCWWEAMHVCKGMGGTDGGHICMVSVLPAHPFPLTQIPKHIPILFHIGSHGIVLVHWGLVAQSELHRHLSYSTHLLFCP